MRKSVSYPAAFPSTLFLAAVFAAASAGHSAPVSAPYSVLRAQVIQACKRYEGRLNWLERYPQNARVKHLADLVERARTECENLRAVELLKEMIDQSRENPMPPTKPAFTAPEFSSLA